MLSGATYGVAALALDASGNTYLALPGIYMFGNGLSHAVKVNSTGSAILYRTSFGSVAVTEDIIVSPTGTAYVTGYGGLSFPVTAGAYRSSPQAYDLFYVRLAPNGTPDVATYIGGPGNELNGRIAVDSTGVYVLGNNGRPRATHDSGRVSQSSYGGGSTDAFLLRVRRTVVDYATYFGAQGADATGRISTNGAGTIFVGGSTDSTAFPVTLGALQPAYKTTPGDLFLARFDFVGNIGLSKITPSTGGNGGSVSVHIAGFGLAGASSVLLRRGGFPDIVATQVRTSFAGQSLTARFELTGKPLGKYDVVVQVAAQSLVLPMSFEIVPPR